MDYLVITGATKRFGNVAALDDVSLTVAKGEFFTLLGPSGCGKTTLLRSIAGFNELTSGGIGLGGADLLSMPPYRRDIGMVFQDYAVFPHLTVFDNVAFGLRPRRVSAPEIKTRVAAALQAVHLEKFAGRLPAAMSGGQQQRIGLARAMVISPRLLLMDEPLSNLDAKLRIELREEIRDMQRQVDIATIYVTHDQEEALAISDRICVMNAGRVEQIGTPQEIYGNPQTRFVAEFVGTLNVLMPGSATEALVATSGIAGAECWAVRPERLLLAAPGEEAVSGTVSKYTYLGREANVQVDTPLGRLVVQVPAPGTAAVRYPGDPVSVRIDPLALMCFDASGRRLGCGR